MTRKEKVSLFKDKNVFSLFFEVKKCFFNNEVIDDCYPYCWNVDWSIVFIFINTNLEEKIIIIIIKKLKNACELLKKNLDINWQVYQKLALKKVSC